MLDHLQTEARNPASVNLDSLTSIEMVRLMNHEDSQVSAAVASQAPAIAQAIDIIASRLREGGRLIYMGAGTSGRLGVLDATECPPTFNAAPEQVIGLIAGGKIALTQAVEGAEDKPELGEADLQAISLSAKDVVVGIATSGRTPYVLGGLAYARTLGAFAIGFSCNDASELYPLCDLAITPVVGPEVLSGSTRLKAGTATKMVLNMLSTGAFVLLGKTYGNLMVDLRATNSKLRDRANRIVRQFTGVSQGEAEQILKSCSGELKTALVAKQAGVSPEEARARLERAGGQVRPALEEISPSKKTAASAALPDLFLGIDGGGTRTAALLACQTDESDWEILGRGDDGPSNIKAVGAARALCSLNAAIDAAFDSAKIGRQKVQAACLGLAGSSRPEDKQTLHDWARSVGLAQDVALTTDVALLLAAGTPKGWGIAVIAGTGSIAYGRNPDGREARAGGWGYLLGDEGSGYALAVEGLRAVARAVEGRAMPTCLVGLMLQKLQLQEPMELISTIYKPSWDRTALATLAPLVLEAARQGDELALQLRQQAAEQLADLVASAARQLGIEQRKFPLAVAGGLLLGDRDYRETVIAAVTFRDLEPHPVSTVPEPAQGALTLALQSRKT